MAEAQNKNEIKTKADLYLDPKTGYFKEGNPGGGRNKETEEQKAAKKIRKQAIAEYIEELSKALKDISPVLIDLALNGEPAERLRAISEINNRVIGAPKQTIGLDEDDTTTEVNITIKRPDNSDEGKHTSDTDIREELGGVPDKEA